MKKTQILYIKTREYQLPVYWASYLINGDASGLENGEQEEIDAFIEKESTPFPICFIDCGESYFSLRNDANNLGGDVCDFTVQIFAKAKR